VIDPFQHHRAIAPFSIWSQRDCKKMFPKFSDNLYIDNEIIYQQKEHFKNYKGKTLMLVGGGPSSKDGWQDKQYDYLWSMNHFYKNPVFLEHHVDLAMIMGEPDINDQDFKRVIEQHNTNIGFEIHDRWDNYEFEENENFFCMHTRFYGKVGIGARMKLFAAHLGFEKVYFTGCDGPSAIFAGDHFFEPGKKTLPSIFQNAPLDVVHTHWKLQYDFFWQYLEHTYPEAKFYNIGGGEVYHEKCK
tara:strand:+ start:399 stop:1130 length:732 start_codon:yes stop_codon:yes gene_type:complete